jgi:hypothetical protein
MPKRYLERSSEGGPLQIEVLKSGSSLLGSGFQGLVDRSRGGGLGIAGEDRQLNLHLGLTAISGVGREPKLRMKPPRGNPKRRDRGVDGGSFCGEMVPESRSRQVERGRWYSRKCGVGLEDVESSNNATWNWGRIDARRDYLRVDGSRIDVELSGQVGEKATCSGGRVRLPRDQPVQLIHSNGANALVLPPKIVGQC